MPTSPMNEIQTLKELLAEAEDLCIEFAIGMRLEAQRAERELQRLSKEIAEEDAAQKVP